MTTASPEGAALHALGASVGATQPDSMAATRTRPDDGREVKPDGRTDLNGPGTPVGNYGSDGPTVSASPHDLSRSDRDKSVRHASH